MHVAVMTMARNEASMLPRWLTYYGAQVGAPNLFVLDDMSSDGSVVDIDATVVHLPVRATARRSDAGEASEADGGAAFRKTVASNKFAAALLEFYDVVIFVDADEFIIPDPRRYSGLRDFLERNPDKVVAPLGLNLTHVPDLEEPLREDGLLLAQRRHVKVASLMSKPAIKRVAARWTGGTHGIAREYHVRQDILLLHAKFADLASLRRTHEQRHMEFLATGAGGRSTWSMPADQLEELMREATGFRSSEAFKELDPYSVDVSGYVTRTSEKFYRSGIRSVRKSMRRDSLWRLPPYLVDQF